MLIWKARSPKRFLLDMKKKKQQPILVELTYENALDGLYSPFTEP